MNIFQLTDQLIRFPSTHENRKAKKDIVTFCQNFLSEGRVFTKRYESGDAPSLIVTSAETKRPRVFLVGHLDVVPADEADFIPSLKDGRMYGRGSGDMKAAVAVMMLLFKQLTQQKAPVDIGLMLTTDEEVGGMNGVRFLLEDEGYTSDLAIIPDNGSDLHNLIMNQKGIMQIKLRAHGMKAHGSRPFLGKNAIDLLLKSYHQLRSFYSEVHEPEWRTTVSLNKIAGGQAHNQVPDSAELVLDVRYTLQHEREEILERLNTVLLPEVHHEVLLEAPVFNQSSDHIAVQKFAQHLQDVTRQQVNFAKEEGGSDARFFAQKNIPTIICGIKKGNAHANGEWVDMQEAQLFYEALQKFLLDF